jgi:hypothetical protein
MRVHTASLGEVWGDINRDDDAALATGCVLLEGIKRIQAGIAVDVNGRLAGWISRGCNTRLAY